MLEMLLDKKLLFVLMGILTGFGVVDKCIVSMTMKRMVEAAGSMSKSNHPADAPGPCEIRTRMYDQRYGGKRRGICG